MLPFSSYNGFRFVFLTLAQPTLVHVSHSDMSKSNFPGSFDGLFGFFLLFVLVVSYRFPNSTT